MCGKLCGYDGVRCGLIGYFARILGALRGLLGGVNTEFQVSGIDGMKGLRVGIFSLVDESGGSVT